MATRPQPQPRASRSQRWLAFLAAVGVLFVGANVLVTWQTLAREGGRASSRAAVPAEGALGRQYQYLQRLVNGISATDAPAASSLRVEEDGGVAASPELLEEPNEPEQTEIQPIATPPALSISGNAIGGGLRIGADGKVQFGEEKQEETDEELELDIAEPSDEPSEAPKLEVEAPDALVDALDELARRTTAKRGLVLPLRDETAEVGVSLLLDLRANNADLPFAVEVPHCGDELSPSVRTALQDVRVLQPLRFYDLCAAAAEATAPDADGKPKQLFCADFADCQRRFGKGADLRALAVIFSQFDEVLLVEAAMSFFRSPFDLWETTKALDTGVILFHDRITAPGTSLDAPVPISATDGKPTNALREYLRVKPASFLSRFASLPNIARTTKASYNRTEFAFKPSDFLLSSHSILGRTGHQTDAALVLWTKSRQRRATALLAAFLATSYGDIPRPPSHGDKELFFLSLELAETLYAYSDYAIGAIGSDFRNHGPQKSIVCGSAAHYYPEPTDVRRNPATISPLLFTTSLNFLHFRPIERMVYYSAARPATDFPGSFESRGLSHGCPFDITGVALTEAEMNRAAYRQKFHDLASQWVTEAKNPNAAPLPVVELNKLLRQVRSGELLITEKEAKEAQERREKDSDRELVATLHFMSQAAIKGDDKRGIVLPLYDKIAQLGASLILELRALGVDLPVEVPLCGNDVSPAFQALVEEHKAQFGSVRFYDACALAANATSLTNPDRKVFCKDQAECERRFRSFDIKLLGVFFSRFEEIMLLDADTIFFQSPMPLFESTKYKRTGTLFFNDRIVHNDMYLSARLDNKPETTKLHDYLANFNVGLFRDVPTHDRGAPTVPNAIPSSVAALKFQPSDNLLKGHPWNRRAGHQMDSSCVLWNKQRQPRATAVLLSFIALNSVRRPPSYGDKELFHIACEVSETQYAFSDFGIGAVGLEVHDHGDDASRVCGSMAQYYPDRDGPRKMAPLRGGGSLLYLNSDHILTYDPEKRPVYYSKARPAELYPGDMPDKRYECPWNVTAVKLADSHVKQIKLRQQIHKVVTSWEELASNPKLVGGAKAPKVQALTRKLEATFKEVQELQKSVDDLVDKESHLAYSLGQITKNALSRPRGIVIPMYEHITLLGLSLVLELRDMGVHLPVEVPHCGDIDPKVQAMYNAYKPLGDVRFYDACEQAVHEKSALDGSTKVFCEDMADCHRKFRGFEVKILAVTYSQFEEIMLMDADSIYFKNPASLFDSEKFKKTGTLFFHDRASHEIYYMAGRLPDGSDNTVYHEYMSKYDVEPFRAIPTLDRPKSTLPNPVRLPLNFNPSDFLLKSNVWNKLTGHQQDSSLVFWSKKKQPRATAILASFITTAAGNVQRPPSYGDKEFFFTACELAEAYYSFSDFGIGGFGTEVYLNGPLNSTVCGVMSQLYPIKPEDPNEEVALLHANSDYIMSYTPKNPDKPLYYSMGRPAEYYPGAFGERRMECPFDITAARLTVEQEDHILLRQQFKKDLEAWARDASVAEAAAVEEIKKRVQIMENMETQLVHSLNQVSQRTTSQRGIVLPMFDGIASLGISLVLELRSQGVQLPIEIPHCGDLSADMASTWRDNHSAELGELRVYDVCDRAAQAVGSFDPSRKLFCNSLAECQRKFRGFDVKVLAMVFSQFEEVMMLDADTVFFSDPTKLFETKKYQDTGVLLFNDRISQTDGYLGGPVRGRNGNQVPAIHAYMDNADVSLFRSLHSVPRDPATIVNQVEVTFSFQPSDILLSSHAWNERSGHAVDSSCVLWNKKRQPRATAILASFVALNDVPRPPSYGEKELFFIACELAETQYALSDYAVGGIGTDFRFHGVGNSTICGDMAHYFPEGADAPLLYVNSDNILAYEPDVKPVFYSLPRAASVYPGSFKDRGLAQECPFDVTGVPLAADQKLRLARRQEFFRTAESWAGR